MTPLTARPNVALACGLLTAWVLRWPMGQWEFSGWDRTWVLGLAVRLYRTPLFDFEPPIENFFVQVLTHRGGFEVFPTFAWVGLSTLAGLPLTGRNFQYFHSALETTTLFLVFLLVKRLADVRAALFAVVILAVLPGSIFAGLYPMTTEWTLFLMALGFVLLERYVRRDSFVSGVLSALVFCMMTLSSRTFLIEYVVVSAVCAFVALRAYRSSPPPRRLVRFERGSVLLVVWLPVTLGVLFQFVLFVFFNFVVGYRWGLLAYLLDHRLVGSAPTGVAPFLIDLVLFNGIVLPVAIFAALAATIARPGRATPFEHALAGFGLLYFLPSLVLQRRIDYAPMYFVPWGVLLAMQLSRLSQRRPRAAVAAAAAAAAVTAAWGLDLIRGVDLRMPRAVLQAARGGPFEHARWFKSLNDDDYMKAAGYWIREHVPAGERVALYGGYWQLWTLEVYSGKSLGRFYGPELAFGADRPGSKASELVFAAEEPRLHWAVVLHPYDPFDGGGPTHVPIDRYRINLAFVTTELKYDLVGQLVQDGAPVVSIYSDRRMPFSRLEVADAEAAFDRKYANLASLAFSPFVGWGMNY